MSGSYTLIINLTKPPISSGWQILQNKVDDGTACQIYLSTMLALSAAATTFCSWFTTAEGFKPLYSEISGNEELQLSLLSLDVQDSKDKMLGCK